MKKLLGIIVLGLLIALAASIGKKSFPDKKIEENYEAIKQTILKEKPNGVKGDFILSAFLTSTMGVSYKLKLKG